MRRQLEAKHNSDGDMADGGADVLTDEQAVETVYPIAAALSKAS